MRNRLNRNQLLFSVVVVVVVAVVVVVVVVVVDGHISQVFRHFLASFSSSHLPAFINFLHFLLDNLSLHSSYPREVCNKDYKVSG